MLWGGPNRDEIIILNDRYPIYKFDTFCDTEEIIGYTSPEDRAVITSIGGKRSEDDDYIETVIISGKYYGYNYLAINDGDYKKAIVINYLEPTCPSEA